jgi:hypothetical protein
MYELNLFEKNINALRFYPAIPLDWRVLGAQTLLGGVKPPDRKAQ